ncbi:recombinase family protein [Solibacillus sp. FSL K6-1523]|uniref:recombinase family protein n=1 Tax=Solibacillus sp. FSL K6-1523 TaxID=2921471 RepID=UPI0030FAF20D
MDDKRNLRVFIYIRVSTREQATEGYSIGEQEERLRAYAKAKGYTIIKVYIDPAYSGANMDRPALQEMINQIEQNTADLVLVYKLNRLSRSQKDTLYLIEEVFLKNNVDFVSLNESFDTTTPFGRAMIGVLSVFAQLEREQTRELTMMGKEGRAKKGKWNGGGNKKQHPTGYDYINGSLHVNEYEAQCVRDIYALYMQGKGLHTILKTSEKKYPDVVRFESTIKKILTNPLYIGNIRHKDAIYDGEHQAIIDESTFDTVQELLKKRAVKSKASPYFLSGVIYCEYCGARMFGRTGGKLKDGESMRYYNCYSRTNHRKHMTKDPNCIKDGERKETLEQYVIKEIKKLNTAFIEGYHTKKNDKAKLETLQNELNNIKQQMSNLIDLYSLNSMPIEIINGKVEKLKTHHDQLQQHIKELSKPHENDNNLEDIKKTISQLPDFDWSNEETDDQKRLIVAKLINKIIVSNDNINIEWAF